MRDERLGELRRKERIWTNLLLAVYSAFFLWFSTSVESRLAYMAIGLFLLVLPIWSFLSKHPHPPLLLFSGMKELAEYEREKMGGAWDRNRLASSLILLMLSLLFFLQAALREGGNPFMEGLPVWYPLLGPLVLFVAGNILLRANSRRIDTMDSEKLQAYLEDRSLFLIVFACVATGFALLGTLVYELMT
ncbi:hypothetical protein [Staphylospora marina]|uniref:hypothetical protein n=1 Tax=Staphylospora marina TaxID=2490858 RepID=UPI000F5B94B9|nr:hypothetical protein [Staphylospora marina]